jgi:hypothetical protein
MDKLLARFVRRNTGNPTENDGLILGNIAKAGDSFFKRGYVYEIVEILGEVVIRECGPSWIKPTINSGRKVMNDGEEREVQNPICWGSSAGHILDVVGKELILTEEEYLELCRQAG